MMDVSTARLLRLVKQSGVYIYIRPIAGEWIDEDGLIWRVKVERRGIGIPPGWTVDEFEGADLDALLQMVIDKWAPAVKRRRPPKKR